MPNSASVQVLFRANNGPHEPSVEMPPISGSQFPDAQLPGPQKSFELHAEAVYAAAVTGCAYVVVVGWPARTVRRWLTRLAFTRLAILWCAEGVARAALPSLLQQLPNLEPGQGYCHAATRGCRLLMAAPGRPDIRGRSIQAIGSLQSPSSSGFSA